ncbi:MAG: HEAT repeat domain-containing protein [Armatimonadota bacterium]
MGIDDYLEQTEISACIRDLGDPDNDTQLRAEGRLIDIGISAVEQLIEAVSNRNPTVRWRSAWCLAQIKEPRGFDVVATLLDDPDDRVRHEAREIVGEFGDVRAIPLLAKYVWNAEDDEDTADHAAYYIAAFGTSAIPEMAKALSGGTLAAKKVATYILGEIGDASAQESLKTLIDSTELRTYILVALAKCGDTGTAGPLIELLHFQLTVLDSDELTGEMKNHIPALLASENDYVLSREGIEYAIVGLGEHSVPRLCDLLAKVPTAGQKKIAWMLGLISHSSAIPCLRELLNDPEVYKQAILALGHCGDTEVLPVLLEAIEHSEVDNDFAMCAGGSITGLGEFAVDGLIAITESGTDEAIEMAACALGEIGSERAVAPLARLLYSPNKDVRGYAIDALNQLAKDGNDALAARCLPMIESLMSDPSKENRQDSAQCGRIIRKRLGLPEHPDIAKLEREWEYRIFFD